MASLTPILRPPPYQVPEAERLVLEEPLEKRVELLLVDTTCYVVFAYIARGPFERNKLVVAMRLCMSILKGKGELNFMKFDFLLRGAKMGTFLPSLPPAWICPVPRCSYSLKPSPPDNQIYLVLPWTKCGMPQTYIPNPISSSPHSPLQVMGMDTPLADWVSDSVWGSVQALKELDDYQNLLGDLICSSKHWRKWMELERPEDEPLPGDRKRMCVDDDDERCGHVCG